MDDEHKPSSFGRMGTEDPRFYEALGRAIKVLRAERGLSRRGLAEQSEVSYPYLSEIENGKKRPSSKALVAVASALGLRPSQLLETAESFIDVVSTSPPRSREPYPPAMTLEPEAGESFDIASARLRMPSKSDRMTRLSQAGSSPAPTPASQARPGRSWFGRSASEPPSEEVGSPLDASYLEDVSSRQIQVERLRELAERLSDEDLDRVVDLARRLSSS